MCIFSVAFCSMLLYMILVYGMVHVTCFFSPLIFVDLQFPGADIVGCQGAGDSWKLSFINVRLEAVDLPVLALSLFSPLLSLSLSLSLSLCVSPLSLLRS